ncbi:MAG: L-serine ammonia-lyase, iron-sulfur-dependent, subunit alpha [Salinivirgaceae bacterium]|nr:L-serine ammonia-lyase, iron-sulfur-dependent, subunit alpha [Salinivirgaceae bacterium]
MTTKMKSKQIVSILDLMHREIKPALGCTEPTAVALACGKARETLNAIPTKATIYVSGNIYKNALGVGIPGTGLIGLPIAAALGLTGGNSSDCLEILKDITDEHMQLAQNLIDNKVITILVKGNVHKLYVEVDIEHGKDSVVVKISHKHNHFAFIKRNNEILLDDFPNDKDKDQNATQSPDLSVDTILNFIESVDPKNLEFFNQAIEMNLAIANEGLEKNYGLRVGKNIQDSNKDIASNSAQSMRDYVLMLTTAASDARMGGSVLPVMSNTGSGNQGLTASLPIIAYGEKLESSKSELFKALALGHLLPMHMKKQLGPLSALCGVLLAATGAACGMVLLQGGDNLAIKRAIQHMAANITGMLCDGAKPGCSLKVHSGITAAIQASELALNTEIEALPDGIVDIDVEKTILNIALIGSNGLSATDKMIIDMMQNK